VLHCMTTTFLTSESGSRRKSDQLSNAFLIDIGSADELPAALRF